jgi:hypothetical protein
MKRATGLLLVAGLLVVGLEMLTRPTPAPASAASKPVFLGPFHQEGNALLAECGTFQVLDSYQGELFITAFLDKDGFPQSAIVDFHGTDTFHNSVTGKSFTESFHNKEFDQLNGDLQPDQVTKVGVGVRLTIPGEGAIVLEVGRVVERPGSIDFAAGPHQLLDGDVAGLCAALA